MQGIYVEIDKINPLKLNIVKPSKMHNDIVLDSIIEINLVDSNKYPKVYDLTIPSTLNFGLANGLHVVDTADSGYLSRKFIKAAEDLIVKYDFTVRNASNHIVQFSYGDDNFDPIKLEKVTRIELVEFDNKKMEEVYKHESVDDLSYFENFMTKKAIDKMIEDPNYKNILNDEYEEIMQYRKDLRYNYFNNTEAIGDINTYIPINLYRVIPSQLIKFNIQSFDLSDLTPQYVINTFNEVLKDIIKYLPEKDGNWILFKIIFKSFLSTKKVIKEYRMSKSVYDSIIVIIKEKMMSALINPGELVGIIGAQTLGEISTQLTLNSVIYETDIIVRDANKHIRKVQIGEFIENEIKRSQKIDYMKDKDTTYAECLEYFEIPSCNEQGKVEWKRIEAVTKHPVINKDGSNTMLKVTTEDEREVIATKAKSFLKLIDGKIIACEGSKLKVGDYLPVSTKQIDFEETYKLDLRSVLPMNEYVYGSELEKAKSVMNEHHWWLKHANKTFTLPYNNSNSVILFFKDNKNINRRSYMSEIMKPGYVYCKNFKTHIYYIPDILELNYEFGYLIGAYVAEGSVTKHNISIANIDDDYLKPIKNLCEKFNLNYYINERNGRNNTTHKSKELVIRSKILRDIIINLCGKLSHNKFISDKIIYSNKECLKGLLDAYIGGDGSISKSFIISMCTTSKKVLVDIQNILLVFGIFSTVYTQLPRENRKKYYTIMVNGKQAFKLASLLDMKIEYKRNAVLEILKHTHNFEYAKKYEKIPNEINGEIIYEDRNGRYVDVVFDKIKSIEEVNNTTNYAYDLTVVENRTFNIYNVLCCMDTFHLAGVGAGSLVITQGIPRLRELINLSKNPKEKNMIIYMKDEYSTNKDKARKIQSRLGYTQLKDILVKTEILYDNKNGETDNKEDYEFIKSYKEFSELFNIDNIDDTCLSPWILRLTFDKEGLMNRKITIQEIQETIKENFHNDEEIECIYSDDSVNDVIMRIRIKQDNKGSFLDFMKDFEKQLISLPLRGIMNIKKVELTETNILKYNFDGSLQPSKEWILKTSGSNLLDILSDNAIDSNRTITNDILEFHEIFGIEATRELLYRELYKVYAEKNPNPRHIQILVDIMTYRGRLMQIDRHGLNKNSEIGPIAKASFEEVMNIFTKAALFAEKDNMKGVSANILAGQFCKSGTNSFEILMDEDKLLEKIDIPDYVDSIDPDINEKNIDEVFSTVYNSFEPTENVNDKDFTFGFGIENSKEFELENVISSNIVLSDLKKSNNEQTDENNFNNIDIDTEIKYGDNSNNNLNIDFEKIDIEEPVYEKESEKVKPKKIKVKKEKVEKIDKEPKEDKVKKIKVSKKKIDIENEK
jgi:DNA-directed RNA polymerase beta' subunit